MNDQIQHRIPVLVVDDQRIWRDLLCDVLDPALHDITGADSYGGAKQRLRERAFLVVVTDQRLTDEDEDSAQGIQLLEDVERLQDGTEVIVVTGYPTIKFARKAFLGGRRAYDYILKRPEGGEPFNLRKYRQLVKDASEAARMNRQKIFLQSQSGLTRNFSLVSIARTLTGENEVLPEAVDKALGRLLNPLRPLLPQMGRMWLSQSWQTCEILCWSRGYGKAALIALRATGLGSMESRRNWMQACWRLIQSEECRSDDLEGVSYFVEGMGLDEFETVVATE